MSDLNFRSSRSTQILSILFTVLLFASAPSLFAQMDFYSLTAQVGNLNLVGLQGMQSLAQGRYVEAEPKLLEFVNKAEEGVKQYQNFPPSQKESYKIVGATFADTYLNALYSYGDCLGRLGKTIEAENAYQKGLTYSEEAARSNAPEFAQKENFQNRRLTFLRGLASIKTDQRKFLAAKVYHEQICNWDGQRLESWIIASLPGSIKSYNDLPASNPESESEFFQKTFELLEEGNRALLEPESPQAVEAGLKAQNQISFTNDYFKDFSELLLALNSFSFAAGFHLKLNDFERAYKILQTPGYKKGIKLLEQFAGEEEECRTLPKTLSRFRSQQAKIGILNFFMDSSSLLRKMKKSKDAMDFLIKAKPLVKKIDSPLYRVIFSSHVALNFIALKKIPEAEQILNRAFEQIESVPSPYHDMVKLHLFLQRAKVKFAQRKPSDALIDLSEGEKLARNLKDDQSLWDILVEKGDVLFQENRDQEAFLALGEAIEGIETFRAYLGNEEFRRGFMTDKTRAYETMIKVCLRSNKQREAFHYVERAKARAFLDLMGEDDKKKLLFNQATPEERNSLIEHEKKLQNYRIKGESGDRGGTTMFPEGAELIEERKKMIAHASPELADIYSIDPISPASISALLPSDTALLQYFQGFPENTVNLMVLSDRGKTPKSYSLEITGKDLGIKIRRLNQIIQNPDEEKNVSSQKLAGNAEGAKRPTAGDEGCEFSAMDGIMSRSPGWARATTSHPEGGRVPPFIEKLEKNKELEILSRELYHALLSPAEKDLAQVKRLLIVPHGSLHFLPFSLLRTSENKILVERKELVYLPSGSSLFFCRKRNAKKNRNWLGYALGKYHTKQFSSLPGTEEEVKTISKMFSKENSITFFEDKISISRLREKVINIGILHLATHGLLNSLSPMESFLLIGAQKASVGEVMNWKVGADLTVLSACQSALGDLDSGDEIVGLTRAFLFAGTRSIVSGLWSVPDEPTALLMIAFYQHLLQGETKSEALRQAQLETREKFPDPKAWAAFILTGDWL